jgi:hypothetical protein
MTIITNPMSDRVQAVFLKGHLTLLSKGMSPPRGVRKGDILLKAGRITGVDYRRGEYAKAVDDLKLYLRGE